MKSTKLCFITSLATCAAITLSSSMCQAQQSRPNVIMIMCDDLGWGDVGFNGNEIIKTPNLDRLAGEGITFDRFYTASAVSSPTRASMLTGRNPHRSGVHTANAGILRPEEITIAELLRDEGYYTGHFGKWHLGTLTTECLDANRAKPGNENLFNPPRRHGYDDSFTTESKVPTWDPMLKPAGDSTPHAGWNYLKEGAKSTYFGTAYWDHNSRKVEDNLSGDDSRVIMDRVIPFIEKSQSQDQPFLAVVWLHAPHMPCVAGPEYAAMYSEYNDDFKNFAGCITAVDDQIGRLRTFLEECGLDENTMIWFNSDNGPEECDAHGGGVTGGFRERKRSLHEGGVRVPAFVYWKSGVEGGYRSDYLVNTNDLLPTIVSAAGVDPAKCKNELDGVDISDLFKDKRAKRQEPVITIFAGQATYSDNQYKIYLYGGVIECYDIVNDPYETNPMVDIPDLDEKIAAINKKIESFADSYIGGGYVNSPVEVLSPRWNPKFAPAMDQYSNVAEAIKSSQFEVTKQSINSDFKPNRTSIALKKPTYDSERKKVDIELVNYGVVESTPLEVRVLYGNRSLVSGSVGSINPQEQVTLSLPLFSMPVSKKGGYEVIVYDQGKVVCSDIYQ